jgi:hypothetical protein
MIQEDNSKAKTSLNQCKKKYLTQMHITINSYMGKDTLKQQNLRQGLNFKSVRKLLMLLMEETGN